jgi:hypothetical protein
MQRLLQLRIQHRPAPGSLLRVCGKVLDAQSPAWHP